MDWTALQRTSLALTSGVPCLAVQSAREQQSLHTWYLQSNPAAFCICVLCRNFLLTTWTVRHYCKQCWDDETLTALNSYAWPLVMNRVSTEGATLHVLCCDISTEVWLPLLTIYFSWSSLRWQYTSRPADCYCGVTIQYCMKCMIIISFVL